jgi:diguanylate cyclase (GGDEF)-like protein
MRILMDIRSHNFAIGGEIYRISVSIGHANFPEVEAKGAMELFMRADEALYRAKRLGRDRVSIYGVEEGSKV